jgi:aryl-alcohol dehydrogenase-like predicted oxidoreductase
VIRSGGFDTLQVPYNLLNPSAGSAESIPEGETNYGNIIFDCQEMNMGVFAIRVFAGGALLGQLPSDHTLKTPYFPLALYERDSLRAKKIEETNRNQTSMSERAIRFALAHPAITSAIIGLGSSSQVLELANLNIEE